MIMSGQVCLISPRSSWARAYRRSEVSGRPSDHSIPSFISAAASWRTTSTTAASAARWLAWMASASARDLWRRSARNRSRSISAAIPLARRSPRSTAWIRGDTRASSIPRARSGSPRRRAAVEIQLLLDLRAGRVGGFVTELAKLVQVATEGPLGHPGAVGQLERVQARLGNDGSQDVEETGEPAGSVHAGRFMPGWLAYFFPGGGVALKRIGLRLFLVPDLLVEPACDHLVCHRLGNAKLGERLDLVGHHFVAGSFDRSKHFFDGRRPLDHGSQIVPKPTPS